MPMVSRLCTQIILMEHGNTQFHGNDVGKAIDLYYTRFVTNESNVVFDDGSLMLEKAELLNAMTKEKNISQLNWGDNLKLYFKFTLKEPIETPLFRIQIYDKEQRPVAILDPNTKESNLTIKNNQLEFVVTHQSLQFSKGIYTIDIALFKADTTNHPLLRMNGVLSFQVIHNIDHFQPFLLSATYENFK